MKLECKSGCGKCCEVGGTGMALPVTREEGERIAVALGRPLVDSSTVPSTQFTSTFARGAHCPAYDSVAGACKVYSLRPQVCRDFQCNGEDRFTHSAESLQKLTALASSDVQVADIRDFLPESLEATLARHEKIAFQFSGGKDSTATLLLLRPYWDRFTVYFCESGDSMPETLEIVDMFANMVPNFAYVQGRVKECRETFGLPTDVVPWTSSYAAHSLNNGKTPLMQDRVACCFRSVMEPMHERMVADGITLVIRGQKDTDKHKGALRSGMIASGIEFLYPVQDWTDEECFAYMRQHGVEPQLFYAKGITHSGDCMGCTAWCEDDRGSYLREYHPVAFVEYKKNMQIIGNAVAPIVQQLVKELDSCEE